MAEQEYVATRPYRAGGDDFVGDFERGEVVPLDKIADPWILKETGDVVLAVSDEGQRAIADREHYQQLAREQQAKQSQAEEEPDATDAAKRKADELGVDLSEAEPSGTQGDILVSDVKEAAKPDATEAAERKAEELGIDLSEVEGTGAGGRITVGDVEEEAKQ